MCFRVIMPTIIRNNTIIVNSDFLEDKKRDGAYGPSLFLNLLFYSYRFGKISGLIHITTSHHCYLIGDDLQGHNSQ